MNKTGSEKTLWSLIALGDGSRIMSVHTIFAKDREEVGRYIKQNCRKLIPNFFLTYFLGFDEDGDYHRCEPSDLIRNIRSSIKEWDEQFFTLISDKLGTFWDHDEDTMQKDPRVRHLYDTIQKKLDEIPDERVCDELFHDDAHKDDCTHVLILPNEKI